MNKAWAPSRYVDHIGFTVPNLEQAVDFFSKALGAELLHTRGPYEAADNWMQEHLNVHPRSVIRKMGLMKLPSGPMLEIFQYEGPDHRNAIPKNSDVGGHHLAFFVDDINEATRRLRENGIKVLGDVHYFEDGPTRGQSWVYFMAPWGMQLELVSYPPGWPFQD